MARKPKRAVSGVLGTLGARNLQAARMLFLLLAIGVATRAMAVAPTADAPPSTPLVVDVDGAQLIDLRGRAAPTAQIEDSGAPNGLPASGVAGSPRDAQRVQAAAKQYLGEKDHLNFN